MTTKKLKLSKESLRDLSTRDLETVKGGGAGGQTVRGNTCTIHPHRTHGGC